MTTRSHARPRPTFENLPDEKRRRIVELAIDEFSERPYSQASLSRIVARAGIAKGSVYQYFPNKLELYRWLVTRELADRKRAALATVATRPGGDVFAQLEQMVYAGMRFQLENPRLARLAANLFEPDADPAVSALHRELREAGRGALRSLLTAARRAGAIPRRTDLDVVTPIVAHVLGPGLAEVLLARMGTDLRGFLKDPSVARTLKESELRSLVRTVVGVLRHGLAGPTAPPRRTAKGVA